MADNIKMGELLNERSPVSKTFMNFDGSRTVEFHNDVIHFQDTEGKFHEIDTTLYDESDFNKFTKEIAEIGSDLFRGSLADLEEGLESGGINRDEFDYQGVRVPFIARLPKIFNRGYLVGDGVSMLHFKPFKASPSKGYIDPRNRSVISYQDVWNDADVTLELKSNGVKETIILKSNKAPTSYRFEVLGELSDDLKAGRMQLAPAWLKDANGTYRDVEQRLKYDDETGSLYLSLDVDTTDLVFPVYVDPTITVSNRLGSAQENYVIGGSQDNTVTLNPTELAVGWADTYRIYMKYPELTKNIPSGAIILDAKMNVRLSGINGGGPNQKLTVHAVTTDYTASNLTWRNAPAMSESIKGTENTFTTSTTPVWFSWDIKDIVQAATDGTQVVALGMKTPASQTGGFFFWSSSSAISVNRPYLSISFNMPPTKPTVTKPNGGETYNSLESINWVAANDIRTYTHEPFTQSYVGQFGDYSRYGQAFRIPDDNVIIKSVSLKIGVAHTTRSYNMYLTKAKVDPSQGTLVIDDSTIYAQQVVTVGGNSSNMPYVTMSVPNVAIPKDTPVAVWIRSTGNEATTFYVSQDQGAVNTGQANIVYSDSYSFSNMLYKLEYTSGTAQSALTYQIQLSSNNGSTWKDIVPQTNAGVTTYNYDFINETESALSKIRIRAYDGYNYGDWDESDGVFTIQHNVAPSQPTSLAPNGTIEDRGATIRMAWQHNDPNGNDPQSKFDLQWRVQGNANWTTVTQSTTNQFYNASANLFAANSKIEWRVRTYDQAGLAGPYSNVALFTASVRTAPPTVVYPTNGASVPISRPTFQWSHPNQVKYWVQVKVTSTGAVFYDFSATSTNKALTINKDLANSTGYTLEVAVMDENGLWSTFATVPFQVSYTPPNKPALMALLDNDNGWITVVIDSANNTGTTPATNYYDIFRKGDNGEWIKLVDGFAKTGPRELWTDRTPAPTKEEQYFVRAYGANGTVTDSDVLKATVRLKHVQIALASDPTRYVTLNKREAGKEMSTRKSVTTDYVGRPYPLTEFSDNYSSEFDYTYKVYAYSDVEMMRSLAYAGEALLLRDNWGRKDYVTIDKVDIQEARIQWNLTIHPIKIYYVEGII